MKHNNEGYIDDLAEIRTMMQRSSRFMSLSGWSGVLLGLYSLAGVFMANLWMQRSGDMVLYSMNANERDGGVVTDLAILAGSLVVAAFGTAILLSIRKAGRRGEQVWNGTVRQMLVHMLVPLAAGGILGFILAGRGLMGLLLPVTLIFYGITLFNAARFSYRELQYLGIINISLGLFAAFCVEYGLLLWAIGFGVMHIIYGLYIYLRYER